MSNNPFIATKWEEYEERNVKTTPSVLCGQNVVICQETVKTSSENTITKVEGQRWPQFPQVQVHPPQFGHPSTPQCPQIHQGVVFTFNSNNEPMAAPWVNPCSANPFAVPNPTYSYGCGSARSPTTPILGSTVAPQPNFKCSLPVAAAPQNPPVQNPPPQNSPSPTTSNPKPAVAPEQNPPVKCLCHQTSTSDLCQEHDNIEDSKEQAALAKEDKAVQTTKKRCSCRSKSKHYTTDSSSLTSCGSCANAGKDEGKSGGTASSMEVSGPSKVTTENTDDMGNDESEDADGKKKKKVRIHKKRGRKNRRSNRDLTSEFTSSSESDRKE